MYSSPVTGFGLSLSVRSAIVGWRGTVGAVRPVSVFVEGSMSLRSFVGAGLEVGRFRRRGDHQRGPRERPILHDARPFTVPLADRKASRVADRGRQARGAVSGDHDDRT